MTEADVLRAVSDYLAARGFHVERRNTGAMAGEYKGKQRFIRFSKPGQADLYGWDKRSGRHIEVEVKAPGKGPTAAQYVWLSRCSDEGAIAFWADSVDRAAMALTAFGY